MYSQVEFGGSGLRCFPKHPKVSTCSWTLEAHKAFGQNVRSGRAMAKERACIMQTETW